MFIDEQTIQDYNELNDEMHDLIVDIAAHTTPILSVYTTGKAADYLVEIMQWQDMLRCLVSV